MNYRHAFHAGNFADVHKHLVLVALLERLKHKPKPLCYLDTHAGRGWYDLGAIDARRGGEWREGIARLEDHKATHADVRRYLQAVSSFDTAGTRRSGYPGSPALALWQQRDGDRLVLVESESVEAQALKTHCHGRNVAVVRGDGYIALKSYLPPPERRGLVLIDPPYEAEDEFERVAQALEFGLGRWPTGMFALWYPLKASAQSRRMLARLKASGLRKLLQLELYVRPADAPVGLNGSGLLIANPPWQFDVEIRPALQEIQAALAPDTGAVDVRWLVEE